VALKARMPWLDINQERHHPYAGYEGMVELVQEIDRAIFNPVWQQVRIPAPWGDDGETLGAPPRPMPSPVNAFLSGVAAKAMGLEPEEIPV
jgi:nitrogenase molybdenum-cofactor synthesis protein NifE